MSSLQQPEQNDHHPASGVQKIDRVFIDRYFKQHFARLCLQYQYKFGFGLDLTKEVVHTAFIKLWETRYQLESNLAVKAYLDRIITNNCLDIIKHEKVKTKHRNMVLQHEISSQGTDDFLSADLKEMSAQIQQAVADLPEQMRKIFILSRYDGLKYTTIAEELGISVKTVETQMSRALQKLRISLSQYLSLVLMFLPAIGKYFI